MGIKIAVAKQIREQLGLTHIVIFGIDEKGCQYIATHGGTKKQAEEAAIAGNNLKIELGWHKDLCASTPLERVCKNCAYYSPDYGMHCFNGWTGDGSEGNCRYQPKSIKIEGCRIACIYFMPNC